MTRALMIQGTGSNVGKSLLVAGLVRACARRGMRVLPFKPQNMSNNAAVTADGGEIGRAQALQARAAGVAPHTDMNPVLLKPASETGAQVIVQGQCLTTTEARDYGTLRERLLPAVMDSFARLGSRADLVLVEGAGSPAEVNLRARDIANMGFARAAEVPVLLVGDIDRGGVIAQIVGTHAVLDPGDRAMIRGFAINRFRGDPRLFDDGLPVIERATGWPGFGVVPWFDEAWRLPAEDVMDIETRRGSGTGIVVAVPRLPRIANFDDLDPLAGEPGVDLRLIAPGHPLPGDARLVLLPGSKATIADLAAFRAAGWDIDLAAHIRRGGHVLGLCGGYQMLGRSIADPDGLEGPSGTVDGLGHLDVATVLHPKKHLSLTRATYIPTGDRVAGYEIHMGQTEGPGRARAWLRLSDGTLEGATGASGRVLGSYMHGLFSDDGFRAAYLARLGAQSDLSYEDRVEDTLDALATHLEANLDIDGILRLAAPMV
ncbi:cobyric acid synthase [Lutimaribacter sp. EGI FJ00015]|uniref:Cobyric acid synthase n=1 Tax=Lutimaribacter degradans TaxID=2945989 RepID=A0ACC5ZVW3_9RHOB|nr:cobyric acid synthase [Lutimaribacter sp. EGI FJ00013]MCM2562330.1 cobyric acid synthase [Lutimaribacter sp. EGI FJ00013]MCO0613485.1 cobyric acid synthase [Lutimaribacter sp. EGI FJ00015]MCO0636459.1 cobyric acid synthase [Lutimaribacter sp. EGI FJ00014]